jgi:hypothetical protein
MLSVRVAVLAAYREQGIGLLYKCKWYYADAKSVLICEICGKKSKQSFAELNLKEIKFKGK